MVVLMRRRMRNVECVRCGKVFERYATQPTPASGWRCSKECKVNGRLESIGKACSRCGKLIGNRTQDKCAECVQDAKLATCEACGKRYRPRFAKKRKRHCCSKVCRKQLADERRQKRQLLAMVDVECQWCGKVTRRHGHVMAFCNRRCKGAGERLRLWAQKRLRKTDCGNESSAIIESWIVSQLRLIEPKEESEGGKWLRKLKSLCLINRHREVVRSDKKIMDTLKHDRNRAEDWRHGGAWGRIIYLELKRLKAMANLSESQKWRAWIYNRLSSQRKRMARKVVVSRPSGCTQDLRIAAGHVISVE